MDFKFTLNLSGVDKFAKVLIFKVTFILKWIVPSQISQLKLDGFKVKWNLLYSMKFDLFLLAGNYQDPIQLGKRYHRKV